MTDNARQKIHATCISLKGFGLLLRGPSGSGKSDLALRMLEHKCELIADDWVDLSIEDGVLIARAPDQLKGLLEVRGLGIIEVPFGVSIQVWGAIDLIVGNKVERLPGRRTEVLLGVAIPCYQLDPWEISAAAKVQLVRDLISGSIVRYDD